jgi:hypothetical protein
MNDDDSFIAEQLAHALRTHLTQWYGHDADFVSLVPSVSRRPWSYLLRYQIAVQDGAGQSLLVKIPREPGIDTLAQAVKAEQWYRATELEYQTLRAIEAVFAKEAQDFCSIRALAYLGEWNALVMEEMPASPLREVLLRPIGVLGSGAERRWREMVMRRSGRWLRIFHTALGEPATDVNWITQTRAQVGHELLCLEHAMSRRANLAPLRSAFERVLARQRENVPVATLHGDYSCANVLVRPDGRISVLDMNENVRGSVYQDLATLVVDLRTRKALVIRYAGLLQTRRLAELAGPVLEGYFGAEAHDAEALHLACALAVLRKWRQDEEAVLAARLGRAVPQRIVRHVFRRYYRSLALRFLSQTHQQTHLAGAPLFREGGQ